MAKVATVLCVDDEPVLLATLSAIIGSSGYRVLTATSAKEASMLLADDVVEAIILDHGLSQDEDFDLAQAAKSRNPATKIILHTGDPDAVRHETKGIDTALLKPVAPASWSRILSAVLAL